MQSVSETPAKRGLGVHGHPGRATPKKELDGVDGNEKPFILVGSPAMTYGLIADSRSPAFRALFKNSTGNLCGDSRHAH